MSDEVVAEFGALDFRRAIHQPIQGVGDTPAGHRAVEWERTRKEKGQAAANGEQTADLKSGRLLIKSAVGYGSLCGTSPAKQW